MFKNRKPKDKFAANQEAENKLKRSMVETIQQMQAVNLPPNLQNFSIREWTTSWADMPSSSEPTKSTKFQEIPSTSPSEIISMEETFQDISKPMLETTYTLNLRQLIKIVPNMKKYLWLINHKLIPCQ